ncbi:hypothetical protein Nepgr_030331 [Nepenthes gracilis]|uniref:Uncharacterized protein n=1 Tax=Nepenthes gracilis TaxID=150966 RepID=A0AAD3TEL9_NEPGR|nr:hypothetical protein Nepgr_030331 [Nepenthes gracilis]
MDVGANWSDIGKVSGSSKSCCFSYGFTSHILLSTALVDDFDHKIWRHNHRSGLDLNYALVSKVEFIDRRDSADPSWIARNKTPSWMQPCRPCQVWQCNR